MRRLVVLAACLVAPVRLTGQQVEVTLDDAVQQALRVQPAIVQARGALRNASAEKRNALGAFLPSLTTSWAASRNNLTRIDAVTGRPVDPEYIHTLGFTANLTLFDALGRYSSLRESAAQLDAADAGYVSQRFQVILETKQAFYAARANEALVRVAEAQVRRAEQQLQIAIEKLRAGSATRSDSLRSVVEHGNARLDLLRAQANLATAQANLGRQIGVEVPVRAVGDTVLPQFPDTAQLRAEAVSSAPAVQVTEAEARAARHGVWGSRSLYFPTINVSFSDNYQGTGWPEFFGFDSYTESFTWRFGLSWTVFNGFTRETQNTAAAVRRDVAEVQAADSRRQVNAQVTQQLATLANSYLAIDIARDNVAAATEDLRVQSERYRVGASTILDLLASQAALTNAEVNLVQSLFDYVIARAQLEALLGRTL
ncbi:MAG TPA: TolC family protein [Gemmatimonadales bacterium]|jgi:outer membrane protein TolC|nr:TolC family protein [Gemmatimonadales bacterium]